MTAVCIYFQVHQPYRLRRDFDYFAIGGGENFEDDQLNQKILERVSAKCYLKTNALLLELIERHAGAFKVAFSVSGVALEQLARWQPEVLESFRRLQATGAVEFLGETYYHSLACLYSWKEWKRQVRLHKQALRQHLGVEPKVFRNTELIYHNDVAKAAESLGFRGILAEGADKVLGWRSPNFVYRPAGTEKIKLLLKNYRLSDDIAFRFNDRRWSEWPLNATKFADWLGRSAEVGQTINLFLDYETFGEHQWETTGIFDFLRQLPEEVLARPGFGFKTPTELTRQLDPEAVLDVPYYTSWADTERDLSAWVGNHLQDAAIASLYELEKSVLASKDEELLRAWSRLQTSDHFYYMCTKHLEDGNVHQYFSPFQSPYDAFITYANALNELRHRLGLAERARRQPRRRSGIERRLREVAPPANDLVSNIPLATFDRPRGHEEGKLRRARAR